MKNVKEGICLKYDSPKRNDREKEGSTTSPTKKYSSFPTKT